MKKISFTLLIILCLMCGTLYWAFQKNYITVNFSFTHPIASQEALHAETKKNIKLYYWAQGALKSENSSMVWQNNVADTARYMVSNWLEAAYESGAIAQKAYIETTMLGSYEQLYISLSENPLKKESPTLDAWMNIEGLLKTLKESNIGIKKVIFMVHHKPMTDARLDFSQAWPIDGFFK